MSDTAQAEDKSVGLPTKSQTRDMKDLRRTLERWLDGKLSAGGTLKLADLEVPGGSGLANETLLLDAAWRDAGRTRSQRFVIRIEAKDPLFPGSTAELQYRVSKALEGVPGVPIPKVVALETDPSLLGMPFYLMERIEGRVPQDRPPFHLEGWVTELTDGEREAIWREGVTAMAKLHRVDSSRLAFISDAKDGLRENLDYYFRFEDDATVKNRNVEEAREWLVANFPKDPLRGFSWGDARFGNIMYDQGRCVAIMDWDMVSMAGPMADLAWWINCDYRFSYGLGSPPLPGFGNGRQTLALWEEVSGLKVRDLDWFLAFIGYRSAVIQRRFVRRLRATGVTLPKGHQLENNSLGIQYLVQALGLDPAEPVEWTWPGLDA